MVKAAAANGWIDGPAVALEQLTAVRALAPTSS
jgi:delta-aminolevulinic acid dehydratase/porphobilinogen synthase